MRLAPGSARTLWESLSAPPDPVGKGGVLLLREGREKGEGRNCLLDLSSGCRPDTLYVIFW